jgi:hypothetical protein
LLRNLALQYERQLGKKISLALGLRLQPYGRVPFRSPIDNRLDKEDVSLRESRMGNFAITPEFRYYLGKSAMKGLYLAPYARYADFEIQSAVDYTSLSVRKTAFFKGHIHSLSGGLLFGTQFSLSKNLMLDCWILGGHYGASGGELQFTATLNQQEQDDLRKTLDETDIPLIKLEYDINSNGGSIRSKGGWAGFRGLALNLVYRF